MNLLVYLALFFAATVGHHAGGSTVQKNRDASRTRLIIRFSLGLLVGVVLLLLGGIVTVGLIAYHGSNTPLPQGAGLPPGTGLPLWVGPTWMIAYVIGAWRQRVR